MRLYNRTNKTNCCFECEKRTVGCHSTCEDYKKFQAENEKIKAERYKAGFKREHALKIFDNTKPIPTV